MIKLISFHYNWRGRRYHFMANLTVSNWIVQVPRVLPESVDPTVKHSHGSRRPRAPREKFAVCRVRDCGAKLDKLPVQYQYKGLCVEHGYEGMYRTCGYFGCDKSLIALPERFQRAGRCREHYPDTIHNAPKVVLDFKPGTSTSLVVGREVDNG